MHADEYSETSQTCKLEIFTKCEKGTPYMKDDTEQTMKLEQLCKVDMSASLIHGQIA